MKTAVSIPDPVFKAADKLAERLGLSRSGLYAAAIANFVAAHRSSGVRQALDAVYSVEESELDSLWARAQADSVEREDW